MRKSVLKELVNERIQLQEAEKLGVALSEEEVDEIIKRKASGYKHKKTGKPYTAKEFLNKLKASGVPVSEFRTFLKARSSWRRVVLRKFRYQVNIGNQEIDRLISSDGDAKAKVKTVFKIQRVRLTLSPGASEALKAKRLIAADQLRQRVTSCKQLKKAVGRIDGSSLKLLGTKPADTFPHTMRSYFNNTKDGHLTPPTLTSSGVELYAICQRKKRHVADQSKRKAVKEKLRQQEFQILARRHLQDLRQAASIEYR